MGKKVMPEADVSILDALCLMALIMGAVRADWLYEGALLSFFQNGCILKWFERLKSIE